MFRVPISFADPARRTFACTGVKLDLLPNGCARRHLLGERGQVLYDVCPTARLRAIRVEPHKINRAVRIIAGGLTGTRTESRNRHGFGDGPGPDVDILKTIRARFPISSLP